MPTRKRLTTKAQDLKTPEAYAGALANICVETGAPTILGQAWLAGVNELVTCGHVVEAYGENPQDLVVKFPASGSRYTVKAVKLHPSFLRQKDQLVKFDAAVLQVELHPPESETTPLPISFEKPINVNQPVFSVRYPAHLGSITAAPSPLAQRGHILGTLRKHDPFHLLHDLALAAGDSGSPILDGDSVVAIHCGDTASLPGLNLPTSSIRLALWVDALRELAIKATASESSIASSVSLRSWRAAQELALAFLLSCAFATVVVLAGATAADIAHKKWKIDKPLVSPVRVTVTKVGNDTGRPQLIRLKLSATSAARAFLFGANNKSIFLDSPLTKQIDLAANQESSLDISLSQANTDTVAPAAPAQSDRATSLCLIVSSPGAQFDPKQNLAHGGNAVDIWQGLDRLAIQEAKQPGKIFHQFIDSGS
jgi:hypothetical protein